MKGPDDPDPEWKESGAAIMRAQAKKTGQMMPLKVSIESMPIVRHEELIKMLIKILPLIDGHMKLHNMLEKILSNFFLTRVQ